jgi:hypothetical protein
VTAAMVESTRTLVITGGWNPEYEAIAAVPKDRPEFGPLVEAFESR